MRRPLLPFLLMLAVSPTFAEGPAKVDERRVRILEVFGLHAPYLIVNWGRHED